MNEITFGRTRTLVLIIKHNIMAEKEASGSEIQFGMRLPSQRNEGFCRTICRMNFSHYI